jgi:predicted  nucleic acid-binding Zn-ribbon protein
MITKQSLEERKDILFTTLRSCEETLASLKERVKIIKKEIENTRGAILELECLIDGEENAIN